MTQRQLFKTVCSAIGISIKDLAVKSGTTKQALNDRFNRESLEKQEIRAMMELVNCNYAINENSIICPNGVLITWTDDYISPPDGLGMEPIEINSEYDPFQECAEE